MYQETFSRHLEEHRRVVAELVSPRKPSNNVLRKEIDNLTLYIPEGSSGPHSTFFYIPGNAFVASESGYTDYICSTLAFQANCQVIVPKILLAPEHKFPEGLEDLSRTLIMLFEKKPSYLNIDFERFAIGGYSSGGKDAEILCILARAKGYDIKREILISPIVDLTRSFNGFEDFEDKDKAVSEGFIRWFTNLYLPHNVSRYCPWVSPMYFEDSQLKQHVPVDIIVGENDRFRGDAERYADKLRLQGAIVDLVIFENEDHGMLWHNEAVLERISSQLRLAFRCVAIPESQCDLNLTPPEEDLGCLIGTPPDGDDDINRVETPKQSDNKRQREESTQSILSDQSESELNFSDIKTIKVRRALRSKKVSPRVLDFGEEVVAPVIPPATTIHEPIDPQKFLVFKDFPNMALEEQERDRQEFIKIFSPMYTRSQEKGPKLLDVNDCLDGVKRNNRTHLSNLSNAPNQRFFSKT